VTANVARADAAMLALMRAGFAAVNPALTCYAGAAKAIQDCPDYSERGVGIVPDAKAHGDFRDLTHADWLAMDKAVVERCDAVLRLPGESAVADIETAHAAAVGVPVFYSLASLEDHFREGREVLTRYDLLDSGFAVVPGAGGNVYAHESGLRCSVPTMPDFDDHVREPWWWDFGRPNTRIPQRLCPVTAAGLRRLMAWVREGEKK